MPKKGASPECVSAPCHICPLSFLFLVCGRRSTAPFSGHNFTLHVVQLCKVSGTLYL